MKNRLSIAKFAATGISASAISLVRNVLVRKMELASECSPIVLMHGFAGFRQIRLGQIRILDYFNHVSSLLGQMGFQVFAPEVAPFNSPTSRAQDWLHAIEAIREETGAERVHLIGHSQGGLDARILVAPSGAAEDTPNGPLMGLGYGPHVASLTTVGTPHFGSVLTDAMYEDEEQAELIEGLFEFIDLVTRIFKGEPQDAMAAIRAMSRTYMLEHFNRLIQDDPNVPCFAIAGDPKTEALVNPLMKKGYEELLGMDASEGGGPNDGMVTVASGLFGNLPEAYAETFQNVFPDQVRSHWRPLGVIQADHVGEIGIPLQFPPNEFYDHLSCFAGIAQFLDPAYIAEMELEFDGRWRRTLKEEAPRSGER